MMRILSLIAVLIGVICSTQGRIFKQGGTVKASDWVFSNSTNIANSLPHTEEEEKEKTNDDAPEIRSGCVTECVINPARRISCGSLEEDQCAKQGCCYDRFSKSDEITCYKRDEKTCPKPACEALKPTERTSCSLLKGMKDMMESEFYCVNVGCCWDNSSSIYPNCFNEDTKVEHSNCLYIKKQSRISCGDDLSKEACRSKGCCFSSDNEMNAPWCYHSDKMYYSEKNAGYSKAILKTTNSETAEATTPINNVASNEIANNDVNAAVVDGSRKARIGMKSCVNLDYKLCGRTNIPETECLQLDCCWVIDVNGKGLCFRGKIVGNKVTTTPKTLVTNPSVVIQQNMPASPGIANPFACLFGACNKPYQQQQPQPQQYRPNSQFNMMTSYEAQQNAMQPSPQDIQKEINYLQQQHESQRNRLNPLSQNMNAQRTANPMSMMSLILCMGTSNTELCNMAMLSSLMGQSIPPQTTVPAYHQNGQRNYQQVSTKTGLPTMNATFSNVSNAYYQNNMYAQQQQQQQQQQQSEQMMQMMCLMDKSSPLCSIMQMMKPVSPSESLTREKWFNFIISHETNQPMTPNVNNPFGGRLNEITVAPTGDDVLDKRCKAASKAKETAGVSCPCGGLFSSKPTPTTEKECVAQGCCWIKDLQSQLMESLGPMAILLGPQLGMSGMSSNNQPKCIESLGQKRISKMTMFTTMYGSQSQQPISSVAICSLLGKQQKNEEDSNEGERGLNPLALTMMATQGAQGGSGMSGLLMASLLSGDSGSSDIASMIPLLSMMSNQQTNRNPTTGQTGYGSPAYTSPMEPAAPSPMANMGLMYSLMASGNDNSMASKLPLLMGMMGQGGSGASQMSLPLIAMMASNDNDNSDGGESSSTSSSLSSILPLVLAGGSGGMSGMNMPAMMMMLQSAGGNEGDSSSMSELFPLILQMQGGQTQGSTAGASSSMSSIMSLLPLLSQSSPSSSDGLNPALISLLANGGGSPGMSSYSQSPSLSPSIMTSLLPLISSNNNAMSSLLPTLLGAGGAGMSPFSSPLSQSYGGGFPSGGFSSSGFQSGGYPSGGLSSLLNQGRTNTMFPGLATGTGSRSLQINANQNDTHDEKIFTAMLSKITKDREHSAKPETTTDPACLFPPGATPTPCTAQTQEDCQQMNCCWGVTMPAKCVERTT